ncbi:UNVERIFIED_CONTAM: hypothetical protein FKN15_047879 [Acipenser sinensis]
MGKGFYISKTLAVVGILLAAASIATIIALAVVYSNEKAKNTESVTPTDDPATTGDTAPTKPSSTTSPPQKPWNKIRLPDSLKPLDYDVKLWPRLTPNTDGLYIFTGESTIIFECVKATSLILIHSKKLNLTEQVQLSEYAGSTPPAITNSMMVKETEFLVIELNSNLETGKTYSLFTKFVGELADDLAGFYRSEYMEDGVKKIVATTQMQATDARKSFPCFDEPAMKARFNITLTHEPDRVALSNSPVQMTTQDTLEGKLMNITVFQPTAKMSTYLLAFIVSDFKFIENMSGNVLIRIWARQKAIAQGQGDYALNVTGPILKYFESYYNTAYPLPKSDQIALPDFNAGAMENWGLITYRETALLYDPHVSSTSNKERVVTIIAHELAHQWFGNLVTVRWWNDLWLNEGFASYVEYLGADYAEPSWNIAYLRKQVTPLFDYYENLTSNWTVLPPGHTEQYNQINAVSVACKNGVRKCQELASSLYQEWMDNPSVNPIEPNLRTSIYCSAISTGGAAEWDFGWEMFKNATIATEADKLRSALSCATQPWILNRYLEYSLQADKIRKQDATSTIVYIAGNVVGQSLAWDFIRSQWKTIFNQYGGGSFSFSSLINGVTQRFSSEFELKQLEQFQKDNAEVGFGSGTRALEQALERTRANIKWLSENKASVLDWFKRELL